MLKQLPCQCHRSLLLHSSVRARERARDGTKAGWWYGSGSPSEVDGRAKGGRRRLALAAKMQLMVTSRWFSGERRLGRVRYAPCNHPPKVPGVVVVCDEN
jgi:hypothetical protein